MSSDLHIKDEQFFLTQPVCIKTGRTVARTLIWGGGSAYSSIQLCPTDFFRKQNHFQKKSVMHNFHLFSYVRVSLNSWTRSTQTSHFTKNQKHFVVSYVYKPQLVLWWTKFILTLDKKSFQISLTIFAQILESFQIFGFDHFEGVWYGTTCSLLKKVGWVKEHNGTILMQ